MIREMIQQIADKYIVDGVYRATRCTSTRDFAFIKKEITAALSDKRDLNEFVVCGVDITEDSEIVIVAWADGADAEIMKFPVKY